MNRKKPYPIFHEPGEMTPNTPFMGIPGRIWDEALTHNFVANLQRGNEILRRQHGYGLIPNDSASPTCFDSEILAHAASVFGGEEAARTWMSEPVFGLGQQVPIDLCRTPDGRKVVLAYLQRD